MNGILTPLNPVRPLIPYSRFYKNLKGSLSRGLIVIGSPFQSRTTSAAAESSIMSNPEFELSCGGAARGEGEIEEEAGGTILGSLVFEAPVIEEAEVAEEDGSRSGTVRYTSPEQIIHTS